MTRDELLAEIDERTTYLGNSDGVYLALRAVVELHKPFNSLTSNVLFCSGCSEVSVDGYSEYPCGTIQAIEEQLK